jgi:histidyl-tRNA synthetase
MVNKKSTEKAKTTKSSKKKIKERKGEIQSVKGMRDLMDEQYFLYQGFFEKAAEIALYYGFRPIETPMLEYRNLFECGNGESSDIVRKEMYNLITKGGDQLSLRPEGTAGVMRSYIEHGMNAQPQPVMFYYYGPFFRHENPQRGRYRQFYQFGLEILGSSKSINDATIINLLMIILAEAGIKDLRLEINSIGDSECRGTYRRELSNYYKKHLKDICTDCRERLKTNPLRVLDCKNPKCQEIKQMAPESVSYLCQSCRSHFREVLEYLDNLGINYTINSSLVRGLDYYSRTVFEIFKDVTTTDETGENVTSSLALAGGGRYDYLGKTIGSRRDIPAVGASIGVDRIVEMADYSKLMPRIVKKPKIFFIQLSFDAKLKSFEIIEILRKNKFPVTHSLAKDSISAQLALAEKLKVPYAMILGQKEAIDNTVIIRNMDTRSQDTIKIDKLAEYLKNLK